MPNKPLDRSQANREKRWIAMTSLIAAILLTGTKLLVGLSTHSLGILSEAAHSGLDLLAAGLTVWAMRMSGQPADREHTYGHGKFENLSALLQTVLLLMTCAWIVYEAIHRLFLSDEPVHVDASVWAFLIVGLSIVVDVSRSRALKRVASKYNSQALEADALHFASDVWSSIVVGLGLICVRLGAAFGMPWLEQADAVAALLVALLVIAVTWRLGRKAINDLLDSVPRDLSDKVATAARGVVGVASVEQVRIRRSGPEYFADLTVTVCPVISLEQAHSIAHRAEAAVRAMLPGSDVVVHVEPPQVADGDTSAQIRQLASGLGLAVHDIRFYTESQGPALELHVEVPSELSVEAAHRTVSDFEQTLHTLLPDVVRIISHIEPVRPEAVPSERQAVEDERVQAAVQLLQDHFGDICRICGATALVGGSGLDLDLCCSFHPTTNIAQAHELTERMENLLRAHINGLGRVLIHVEPMTQNAAPLPDGCANAAGSKVKSPCVARLPTGA